MKKYKTEEELKEARRAKSKKWKEANKEKVKEYNKKWREANKERLTEYHKDYYETNKEHYKNYYEANKERIKEYDREHKKHYRTTPIGRAVHLLGSYKRRDKQYNRETPNITSEELAKMLETQQCYYCGESDFNNLGLDRIDNEHGHIKGNVVVCCERCNIERQTMDFFEFCKKKLG